MIKQILKCCSDGSREACHSCPQHDWRKSYGEMHVMVGCMEGAIKSALAYMDELEEEILELSKKLEEAEKTIKQLDKVFETKLILEEKL